MIFRCTGLSSSAEKPEGIIKSGSGISYENYNNFSRTLASRVEAPTDLLNSRTSIISSPKFELCCVFMENHKLSSPNKIFIRFLRTFL